jgi:hypothetical protein
MSRVSGDLDQSPRTLGESFANGSPIEIIEFKVQANLPARTLDGDRLAESRTDSLFVQASILSFHAIDRRANAGIAPRRRIVSQSAGPERSASGTRSAALACDRPKTICGRDQTPRRRTTPWRPLAPPTKHLRK